jgi:hypothetical protein
MCGGFWKRLILKKDKFQKTLQANSLGGFFNMYTPDQIKALTEYKQALQHYNTGKITYSEYIEQTIPIWEKLNYLFEKPKK